METLAVVIAGLALLLAGYSFLRQFAIQRRLAAIEEVRRNEEVASRLIADVTVRAEKEAPWVADRREHAG